MAQLPIEREDPTANDDEIMELEQADMPTEDDDIIEMEDGSALVKEKKKPKRKSSNHDDNLVESLDRTDLSNLGQDLVERIEQDIENRRERDKQYAEGIKRTGLSGNTPGGAEFDGASKVVHPMLAKGCVDFASKAIKELMPAGGPVKTMIIGKQTDEKLSRAERKRQYMNWQLTTQVKENRDEFERLLSQLPLGGACYKRWWFDAGQRRLRTEVVFIDDVILPYNAASAQTSFRVTHRQYISSLEFDRRVESGLYIDPNVGDPPTQSGDKSEAREASEAVEGVEDDSAAYNDEGVRQIFMVYADIDAEDNGEVCPYIIHVDAWSKKVLGLYRNWDEDDEHKQKLDWMVEYIFIPWRGPQGIGLNHLIGSMAVAATGALRALLDSAHINNFPGGLKLKSGRTAGQSISVNATELAEIDAPAGIDDIRKLVMPFPFNGPSTVLYTLLEFLTSHAEDVVATANEKLGEGKGDMPVGTTLALIEQGSVNFSAIHMRLHASLKQELAIVHRLNSKNLQDKETVEDLGELVTSRRDFEGPCDIIPVSDPNIFSETQRFAQLQAVMQLASGPQFAQFFRPDKLLRRALKLLNVADAEELSNLPPEPSNVDAIEENYGVTLQQPIPLKVFDDQDDYEHLMAHTHFMSSPMFGQNPLIAPVAIPALVVHCKDHLMALYKKHTKAAAQVIQQVAKAHKGQIVPDHVAHARGAAYSDRILAQMLGPQIMPVLMQAAQQAKAMIPPPQATPDKLAEIAAKQAMAEADRQSNEKLEGAKLDYQKTKDDADRQSNDRAAAAAEQTAQTADQTAKQLAVFQQEGKERIIALQAQLKALGDHMAHQQSLAQDHMSANLQAQQEDMKHNQSVFVQMLADQGAQQLAALNFIFGVQTAAAAPVTTKNAETGATSTTPGKVPEGLPPTGGIVQALLQTMQENNKVIADQLGEHSQAFQQLASGMQSLQEAQSAPRTASFILDANGRKTGVRSTIERK